MIKYIALGTDCKEYFNYDGKPLPIRPLSTFELDQAFLKAIEGVSPLIFDSVIKLKLGVIEDDKQINFDKNTYKDFLKYYNEIDYWVVYFSIKDFQEEDFSFPDFDGEFADKFDDWKEDKPKGYYLVRNMKYVHKLSSDIIQMTSQPVEKLMEVLANAEGKVLATMVHSFHQPLASEAWKLTPLQTTFIFYTRPGAPQILKNVEDLPGIKRGTIEDITKQLINMGLIDG